jgi:hypothetical protein
LPGVGEGSEVPLDDLRLDELGGVMLLDRHEHADDVAKQMAAGLWHAVEEQGLAQRSLFEPAILLVERVRFQLNSNCPHRGGSQLF